MSLLLNEEQSLLKDSAKAFVDENADLASIRAKERTEESRDRPGQVEKIVDLGWTAIPFSKNMAA